METSPDGHLGPFQVKGTLTSEQRQEIKEKTGCSAAIRERGQWGQRMLTVTGPCEKLALAHKMAMEKVELNGEDEGRAPPEPKDPPRSAGPSQSSGWKKWEDWRSKDWPTREEVKELQDRLVATEQLAANNAYRVQVLEGWYWWCNQNQGGHPNAASSWWANPANSSQQPKSKKERRKERQRSPSNVTKVPDEESEASTKTVVPAHLRGDGKSEPIPEQTEDETSPAEEQQKQRRKRKVRKARAPAPVAEGQRTQWKPKRRGG